jgi:hypothetical protein
MNPPGSSSVFDKSVRTIFLAGLVAGTLDAIVLPLSTATSAIAAK